MSLDRGQEVLVVVYSLSANGATSGATAVIRTTDPYWRNTYKRLERTGTHLLEYTVSYAERSQLKCQQMKTNDQQNPSIVSVNTGSNCVTCGAGHLKHRRS